MPRTAEITCPKCHGTFEHTFPDPIPKGKLTCPLCQVTFNCDACNYSWAKWARERTDCGSPCQGGGGRDEE
jgi:hypothetical protein